jgi:hypothetical protein
LRVWQTPESAAASGKQQLPYGSDDDALLVLVVELELLDVDEAADDASISAKLPHVMLSQALHAIGSGGTHSVFASSSDGGSDHLS